MSDDTADDPDVDEGQTEEPEAQPQAGLSPDVVLIWQSLAARRVAYDTMMWQTPALGMTAQAFLLTLALGGQSSALGRAISSSLAAALAIITIQLMTKHRHHEIRDSNLLERIEVEHQFSNVIGFTLHGYSPQTRRRGLRPGAISDRFRRLSSYKLWIAGQLVFLIVSLLVLVLTLIGVSEFLIMREVQL